MERKDSIWTSLTAKDPANGSWILEYSQDLTQWRTSGNVVHVVNSRFTLGDYQMGSGYFYRLASRPPVVRTVGRTLNLPGQQAFGYSAFSTPPSQLSRLVRSATISDAKATLGRVLFYDRRLSSNNSVSCASCHVQEHAFADVSARSAGHLGQLTARNAISLQHIRSYKAGGGLFRDGREGNFEAAILEPISHPVEMGLSLEQLSGKIQLEPYYQELFSSAYGSPEVTSARISESLGDFLESMATFRSKHDEGYASRFSNFTAREKAGQALFSVRCASCHLVVGSPNFEFANIGLDLVYADRGRAHLTGNAADEGVFRVPSLRQVGLTAPYMHDGRFATLRQVIDFYSESIQPHPNLSPPLEGGPMRLSEDQKLSLEAFLHTLTDRSVIDHEAFSDPFRSNGRQ